MSKKIYKKGDLLALDDMKLEKDFALLKKDLLNLRFQKALGELENTSRILRVKKNVARVKTELTRRKNEV